MMMMMIMIIIIIQNTLTFARKYGRGKTGQTPV
jgi:hypothetical protein